MCYIPYVVIDFIYGQIKKAVTGFVKIVEKFEHC